MVGAVTDKTAYLPCVIQAGRLDTFRTLVSRAPCGIPCGAAAGVGAGACACGGAAGAAAGAAVIPFGFTPYGFGVPSGGDQAP